MATVKAKAIKWVTKLLKPVLLPISMDKAIFKLMVKAYEAGHRAGVRSGNKELVELLYEAYEDMVSLRESGDAGNWNETELEKKIKKALKL